MNTLLYIRCRKVLILLFVSALAGCKTTVRYVPVETVMTDTVRITAERIDSVLIRDSVSFSLRGDTVYMEKWRLRERTVRMRDTVWRVHKDSIETPVTVERELTRWERVKQEAGGMALASVAVMFMAAVVWGLHKLRRTIKRQ